MIRIQNKFTENYGLVTMETNIITQIVWIVPRNGGYRSTWVILYVEGTGKYGTVSLAKKERVFLLVDYIMSQRE